MSYAKLKPNKTEYFLIGKSLNLSAYVLLKINLNGDTISQKQLPQVGRFFDFDIQNDSIFIVHYDGSRVIKYDFNGQIISQKSVVLGGSAFNGTWKRLIRTKDSSYYIGNNDTTLYKVSKQGDILWKKSVNYYNYALTNDDGVIGVKTSSIVNGTNNQNYLEFEKIDKSSNSVWKKQLVNAPDDHAEYIIPCTDGGALIAATTIFIEGNSRFPKPLLNLSFVV